MKAELVGEARDQSQASDGIDLPIVIDRSLRTRMKNEKRVEQEVGVLISSLESKGIYISHDELLNLVEYPADIHCMKVFSREVNNYIIYRIAEKDDHYEKCNWMVSSVIKSIAYDAILETRKSVACLANVSR
ncbi:MAG: hypothetical protein PHY30_02695 [Candidatus Pacebacteria bacterium]|nr:hypothetical protein [Candidatus Paceibacterota bacterium]